MRYTEAILKVAVEEIGEVELLHSIPDIDNVVRTFKELVRCKNCLKKEKWWDCPLRIEGLHPEDDWFCADGERSDT